MSIADQLYDLANLLTFLALVPTAILWVAVFPLGLVLARGPRPWDRLWRSQVKARLITAAIAQCLMVGIVVLAWYLRQDPFAGKFAQYVMVACPSALPTGTICLCVWIRWWALRNADEEPASPLRIVPDGMVLILALLTAGLHVHVTAPGGQFDYGEDLWLLGVLAMTFTFVAARLFVALGGPYRTSDQCIRQRVLCAAVFAVALIWLGALVLYPSHPTKYADGRRLGWSGLVKSFIARY